MTVLTFFVVVPFLIARRVSALAATGSILRVMSFAKEYETLVKLRVVLQGVRKCSLRVLVVAIDVGRKCPNRTARNAHMG